MKEKITISVDPQVVAEARAAVAAGAAASVSAYVAEATTQRADRERSARALLDRLGPFSGEALGWASDVLSDDTGDADAMRAAS